MAVSARSARFRERSGFWELLLNKIHNYRIAYKLGRFVVRVISTLSESLTDCSRAVIRKSLTELNECNSIDDPWHMPISAVQSLEFLFGGILLAVGSY